MIINILFISSPGIIILKYKKQLLSLKGTPKIIIITNYLNSVIWTCYGLRNEKAYIAVGNGICNFISLFLLCSLIFYSNNNNMNKSIFISSIFFLISIILAFICIEIIKNINLLYYLSCLSTVCVYLAPCYKIIHVIKTQKYILIPIHSSFFGLLSSLIWSFYGFYVIKNTYTYIPFLIGIFLSIFQILVYLICKNLSEKGKEIIKDGIGTSKKIQKIMEENINKTLTTERHSSAL